MVYQRDKKSMKILLKKLDEAKIVEKFLKKSFKCHSKCPRGSRSIMLRKRMKKVKASEPGRNIILVHRKLKDRLRILPSLTPLSPSHLPSSRPRTSLIVEALIASLMHLNLDDVWLVLLCFNAGACRVQGLAQLLLAVLLGFMKNLFLLVQASVLEGLVDFCERSRESRDIMFLLQPLLRTAKDLHGFEWKFKRAYTYIYGSTKEAFAFYSFKGANASLGVVVGRAFDLTTLSDYYDLTYELEKLLEIRGELRSQDKWRILKVMDFMKLSELKKA
ncbi:Auxin response factor 11 [Glycine soja]